MHADYACRVLMYLATNNGKKSSIQDIATSFGISENHLVKVVHELGKLGFLTTTRGRGGGIALGRDPKEISIGEVVRKMEPHFHMVECFDESSNRCPLIRMCQLKAALAKARDAFLETLDPVTLADITANQNVLRRALDRNAR